jgi:hypothetical protein
MRSVKSTTFLRLTEIGMPVEIASIRFSRSAVTMPA